MLWIGGKDPLEGYKFILYQINSQYVVQRMSQVIFEECR